MTDGVIVGPQCGPEKKARLPRVGTDMTRDDACTFAENAENAEKGAR